MAKWGLQSSRKQAHTFDSVTEPIRELQRQFPNSGAGTMKEWLQVTTGMRVPKYFIYILCFLSRFMVNTGN